MKRRTFITALLGTATVLATEDAYARPRRRPRPRPQTRQQKRRIKVTTAQRPGYRQVNYTKPPQPNKPKPQQEKLTGLSRREMIQKYGLPSRSEGTMDVWNIPGTSDGIHSSDRLVVVYNEGKVISTWRNGK